MNLNDYAVEAHEANRMWWLNPYRVLTPLGNRGTLTDGVSTSGRRWVRHDSGATVAHLETELTPISDERLDRNKGELLMLMVSELAEAMEGERKNLMDDKLPHRPMVEVELADCLIRIFDYAGAFGLDLEGAYREKMAFNAERADHKHEARRAADGKRF